MNNIKLLGIRSAETNAADAPDVLMRLIGGECKRNAIKSPWDTCWDMGPRLVSESCGQGWSVHKPGGTLGYLVSSRALNQNTKYEIVTILFAPNSHLLSGKHFMVETQGQSSQFENQTEGS